jgi:F0F1-type ATP synthase membrane subunit b/b'
MASKSEKEQRKQLLNELRQKAQAEFEQSLPMSRTNFTALFDYLDKELTNQACDDTTKLTRAFLENLTSVNAAIVLAWLAEQGGYCDCEILANVEEGFE